MFKGVFSFLSFAVPYCKKKKKGVRTISVMLRRKKYCVGEGEEERGRCVDTLLFTNNKITFQIKILKTR